MHAESLADLKHHSPIQLFWFRRDLRLEDNAGLYHALKKGNVLPIFIFDTSILDQLEDKQDARVHFIHEQIKTLKTQVNALQSDLRVFLGKPIDVFTQILSEVPVQAIYSNHDYEPYAIDRDAHIQKLAKLKGIEFYSFKDQVIFEKSEVLKDNGSPYTVFTPYSKKWKEKLNAFYIKQYPSLTYQDRFVKIKPSTFISLQEIGFEKSTQLFPSLSLDPKIIEHYAQTRDIPSIKGTSRLSIYLRFGTVSVRALTKEALKYNPTWLNELIWREFYMCILYHFPYVTKGAFKKQYDAIVWKNDLREFEAWCQGKTGYPIVDAGMRELNQTGFMHNRVRMITASFLCKHLLIDWRWGEAYFAQKLLDFDLSANNGGWQWAASTGCDAVPYFRIFNPTLQTERFDPELKYVKKWVPEYEDPFVYPKPIVQHEFARKRAIETYKNTVK